MRSSQALLILRICKNSSAEGRGQSELRFSPLSRRLELDDTSLLCRSGENENTLLALAAMGERGVSALQPEGQRRPSSRGV